MEELFETLERQIREGKRKGAIATLNRLRRASSSRGAEAQRNRRLYLGELHRQQQERAIEYYRATGVRVIC